MIQQVIVVLHEERNDVMLVSLSIEMLLTRKSPVLELSRSVNHIGKELQVASCDYDDDECEAKNTRLVGHALALHVGSQGSCVEN